MICNKILNLTRLSLLAAIGGALLAHAALAAEPYGTVERKDPRLDQLIAPDATIEKLGDGCAWAEGPIWIKDGGYLLFSDVRNNRVMKYTDGEGLTEWMKPSGFTGLASSGIRSPGSNGLIVSPGGNVVFCEHGDRRVSLLEKEGGKRTLVDNYQGKRLNSPNDGIYKSNGDLYFTDPPYGLPREMNDPRMELGFSGVYRLAKDGQLTLLTKDMTRPNGIGFSPDEKTLYVANSDGQKFLWMAFPVKDDGTLGAGKVLFDETGGPRGRRGAPDGLRVDAKGNIWATGPGGLHVFAPDGTLLGLLNTPETAANCCFGGADGSTLYLTATTSLARIKTKTKGQAF